MKKKGLVTVIAMMLVLSGILPAYANSEADFIDAMEYVGEANQQKEDGNTFEGNSKLELSNTTTVAVTFDKDGKVIKVVDKTDFSTRPGNKKYMDIFKKGKGFDKYISKVKSEIEKLEILKPGKTIKDVDTEPSISGMDGVSGATYTAYEVRYAVLDAYKKFEQENPPSSNSKPYYGMDKVKFGEASKEPGETTNSELPYEMKVKVIVDDLNRITKVEDFGTNPYSNPYNNTAKRDKEYLDKYLKANGYAKFKGKTLEEVKKMQMLPPNGKYGDGPGVDAVAGATACSLAAKGAVIDALSHSKSHIMEREGYYHPTEKAGDYYEIKMINYLPKDYKPVLEKVTYGIFNGKDTPQVKGIKLTEDGKKLKFKDILKPGYYNLNLRDKSGKYPAFNFDLKHTGKFTYPGFAIYESKNENKVELKNGKISYGKTPVEDLVKNVEEIKIKNITDNKETSIPMKDKDGGINVSYVNGDYAKNPFFKDDGSINYAFKDLNGKNIFEKGKKYNIEVVFWNLYNKFTKEITVEKIPEGPKKPDEPNVPKKPSHKVKTTKTVKGITYKVLNQKAKTAVVVRGKKNVKNVTIANTVKIGKKNYKVVGINNKAFKNNKKLKSVVIGKNIKTIGKEAFRNCKSLKNVTFKGKVVKTIGKNAFKGTHKKIVVKISKKMYKKYAKLLKKAGISKKVRYKKTR